MNVEQLLAGRRLRWGAERSGTRRRSHRSHDLRVTLGTVVLAVLLAFTPGRWPLGTTDHPPWVPSAVAVSLTDSLGNGLESARASLARGEGPALSHDLSCAGSSSGVVKCATSSMLVGPNATAADWVNLSGLSPQNPGIQTQCNMAYDARDGYVVLFASQSNTTWTFRGGVWTQLDISGPSARVLPGMAYDAADGYLVLFGGALWGANYNDTWAFENGSWTQLSPSSSPPARWAMSMAYDDADGYVVLYGGISQIWNRVLGDTWTFRAGTWTNRTNSSALNPGPRATAGLGYDVGDRTMVLFGGYDGSSKVVGGTWGFVTGVWTKLSPTTEPPLRFNDALVYDPDASALLLYSGENWTASGEGPIGDMWDFSGGNWTRLNPAHTPGNLSYWAFTWDAEDDLALAYDLYNSTSGAQPSITWSFGPPVVSVVTASPATLDVNQTTRFTVTTAPNSSGLAFVYASLPTGCVSTNVSTFDCTPSEAGSFVVTVSVANPAGYVSRANVTLTVRPDPWILSFTAFPGATDVGLPVSLRVDARNGSGSLRYDYSGLPGGCVSHNTSNLTCMPSTNGTFAISVRVTDALGVSASASLNLTVAVHPTATLVIRPSAIDLGQETWLSVRISGGTAPEGVQFSDLPAGCLSANTSLLVCQPTVPGLFTPEATVTDAAGSTGNATGALMVYAPLSIASEGVAPLAVDLGLPVTFWLNATGGSGLYTFQYTGLPPGCNQSLGPSFTCQPSQIGTFVVRLGVNDTLNESANASVTLTVAPIPAISDFHATPALTDVGEPLRFSANVTVGVGPGSFAWLGLPTGCFPANGPNLLCAPTQPGRFAVHLSYRDRDGQSTNALTNVTVATDPVIGMFEASPANLSLGDTTQLTVEAAGGTGPLWYAFAGLPLGCSTSNTPSILCRPTLAGTYVVTVTVADRLNGTASANTTLSVSASAGPGELLPLAGLAIGVLVLAIASVSFVLWRRRRAPPDAEPGPEVEEEAPPDDTAFSKELTE